MRPKSSSQALLKMLAIHTSVSFFVLGLPHVTLIELRVALISYQDHHVLFAHSRRRLSCGVPVVLMGECGCGKTMLLSYFCAWLGVRLLILDVHGPSSKPFRSLLLISYQDYHMLCLSS